MNSWADIGATIALLLSIVAIILTIAVQDNYNKLKTEDIKDLYKRVRELEWSHKKQDQWGHYSGETHEAK